jgi:hypothetical protein
MTREDITDQDLSSAIVICKVCKFVGALSQYVVEFHN